MLEAHAGRVNQGETEKRQGFPEREERSLAVRRRTALAKLSAAHDLGALDGSCGIPGI